MIINHDQTDREKVWTVGNTKLEQIENYSYLGEIINEKNNMNAHIENKQRRMEAVGRDMANITKDQLLNKIKIGVILELYQECIIPAMLYGAETWQINKKQLNKIEDIQYKCLRRILKTPDSTPKPALKGETGNIYMEQRIKKMQFAYIHKLSQMKETRCLVAQMNYYRDNNMLIPEILSSLTEYNLPTKLEDIELIHKNQWKQMIINSIKQRTNNQYKKAIQDMKKMENLKKYKDSIKRELYLDQTSNNEAQTIFKIRCRMLNLSADFKGSNMITTCPRCNIE